MQWLNYVEDAFILDDEKVIKKLLWSNKDAKPSSSLVKPSFISELNKFLLIYCSVSNFSKKKKKI